MEKTTAFITSDNQVFRTREEAQLHELGIIISAVCGPEPAPVELIAKGIIDNKDGIRAILSERKPRTPKAPKVPAKRKPKQVAAPADEPTTTT